MASGGDANWRVARDEGLRRTMVGILCNQDRGEKDLDGITEGQPLRLRLLRRLLESAGCRGRATSRHPIPAAKDSACL